jgi:hypothetical protein
MRRLGLTLLAVVVTSACFRSTTTITVKQDGSGVIDQEIGASAGAMALLRNFSSGDQADKKTSADVQLFGPEQAQAAAAAMGVRFVSGEPVKTAEVEGYSAHFALDDVTKVKFSVNKTPPRVRRRRQRTAVCVRVRQEQRQFRADDQHSEPKPGRRACCRRCRAQRVAPGQRARDVDAHADASRSAVDVSLVVDGKIIKTNARARRIAGHAVQFDFDKVTAADGALQKGRSPTRECSRTSPAYGCRPSRS